MFTVLYIVTLIAVREENAECLNVTGSNYNKRRQKTVVFISLETRSPCVEKRHSCLSAKRWENDACKKSLANSVFRHPKNRTLVIFFVIIKIEHW